MNYCIAQGFELLFFLSPSLKMLEIIGIHSRNKKNFFEVIETVSHYVSFVGLELTM